MRLKSQQCKIGLHTWVDHRLGVHWEIIVVISQYTQLKMSIKCKHGTLITYL